MCQSLFQHALFHSLGTLARILAVVAIHFRAKSNKLCHHFTSKLVFHLADYFLVDVGEEWVVSWVVRGVVEVCVLCHVDIDVVGFNVDDH